MSATTAVRGRAAPRSSARGARLAILAATAAALVALPAPSAAQPRGAQERPAAEDLTGSARRDAQQPQPAASRAAPSPPHPGRGVDPARAAERGAPAPVRPAGLVDAMRGPAPLLEEATPPPMRTVENKDVRRSRAWSMQPPTIPHKIDGYQVDRHANRCLMCHDRTRVEETQAIPLPVSHYQDREGNTRAQISPRRYVCTTCHVEQTDAKPLVDNTFVDVDRILRGAGDPGIARGPQGGSR